MPNTPSVFLPYKFLSKGRIVIQKSRRATPWEYWLGETHAPNRPVTLENERNRGSDSSFRVSEMNFYVILLFYYSIVLVILRDRGFPSFRYRPTRESCYSLLLRIGFLFVRYFRAITFNILRLAIEPVVIVALHNVVQVEFHNKKTRVSKIFRSSSATCSKTSHSQSTNPLANVCLVRCKHRVKFQFDRVRRV